MKAVFLVTGTRAIAVFADRFIATVTSFVLVRPVVARVAAGTIRLKRRVLPDDDLTVVLVAVCAP